VIVVKRQVSNISAISWREQVNFQSDDDEGLFVLDQDAELDFYSISSPKQQSAGRHYHIGIRAYSEDNIKYFYPLTFRIILITKTVKKNSINFVQKFVH
jgi:hypothetical protein